MLPPGCGGVAGLWSELSWSWSVSSSCAGPAGEPADAVDIQRVVVISIDTCRADHLGCYGGQADVTPHIDAFAAEAVRFGSVVSPVPITLPAHCSLLTGTIPPRHGVHDNFAYRLADAHTTLAELLRGNGFATGAIVSSFVLDAKFGLDQGFVTYDDDLPTKRTALGRLNERRAEATTQRALAWLAAHADERAFLFVHYYDPHAAYEPPEPFATRFADDPYAGEIAYVDDCIGRLIVRLKESNLYDSSLIVVTSDHGEMRGEHGERTHSYFVYQSAVKVPLIVKLPGSSTARRVDGVAGLVDVAPTVCGLLGIEMPACDGRDLSPVLRGHTASRDERAYYCESVTPHNYDANSLHGLVGGRWKYIRANRPELYDLDRDPAESNNLAPRETEIVAEMQAELAARYASAQRGDAGADTVALKAEDRRQLEALGYVSMGATNSGFDLDRTRSDPKDRIEFHEKVKQLAVAVARRKPQHTTRLCEELLADWPGFQRGHVILAGMAVDRGELAAATKHLAAALRIDPHDAAARCMLGRVLAQQGEFQQAIAQYEQVLARDPEFARAHSGLGMVWIARADSARAVRHLRKALSADPRLAEAHQYLAAALARKGESAEAVRHYRQALAMEPDRVDAHRGLATILRQQGELAAAEASLARAIDLAPERPDLHHNLGSVLATQGRLGEAVTHYREAVRLRPDYAQAHHNLGMALTMQQQRAEALEHFLAALRHRPEWLDPLNAAAWILATHPDAQVRSPERAVRLAERAARLCRRKDASVLDTLAAAYASAGTFEPAVATAQEALDLAEAMQNRALVNDIRAHLMQYQNHQAFIAAE
jgi:arylsulfatase A-like enzyme/tetratricopeptide (TPR) repeat protein